MLLSAPRVWLALVGQADEIIYTCVIKLCQPDSERQREDSLSPLVLGIQRLVAKKHFCYLRLCQIRIFAQITYSQFHTITDNSITQDKTSYCKNGLYVL